MEYPEHHASNIVVRKTAFDEDGTVLAVNHVGWDVQELAATGWRAITTPPFPTRRQATTALSCWVAEYPEKEFRVYEAVRRLAA